MQQRATTDHLLRIWQEAIWLLIALLTPLFVNLWVEQQFEPSKVWLLRTLVWVLAVLWLVGWLGGFRPTPLPSPIRNLIILLLLILTLSTLLSTNHYIAIFGTLDRANGLLTQVSYLLLFLCVATRIDTQSSRLLLYVVILTAVPICLLGLAQAAGWQPLPVLTDARSLMTTTLGRANFTGAYLALLLPLTLTAAHSATNNWPRIGYGALATLELIVIALTQARAAWIAAIASIGVLLWLRVAPCWSRRVRWLSALGGLVALGGVLLLILQRGIENAGSIAARWTIWQASLRLLWSSLWLGYGADTLELHFPSVYPPQLVYYQGRGVVVDRAHNWLLDWSLNYGVVATVIFIALVYLILREGWQRLTTQKNAVGPLLSERSLEHHWLVACMASICAQLVGNLFLFEVAATAVVFWLLLAIVTAATTNRDPQAAELIAPLWTRYAVIVAAVLIVGWAVWQSNVLPMIADMHSWRGTQALNQGNPSAALVEYETAVERQPRRAAYHVALALTAAQLGSFEQAEEAMHEAIALRPADPVLYTHLAALYARQAIEEPEKIEMVYGAYDQAIALAPTIALTYQKYADFALRSGDQVSAQTQAQRAVDLDATDGIAFGILGWAQLENGNLAAAESAFEQAVMWQPDSADFALGLATVYFQQGNIEAARQALERSLILNPAYGPALTLQLQLQDR
jgi:O-antigen ligase/Flp pilus assembly protein TadD